MRAQWRNVAFIKIKFKKGGGGVIKRREAKRGYIEILKSTIPLVYINI